VNGPVEPAVATSAAPTAAWRADARGLAGWSGAGVLGLVALYAAAVYLPFLGSGRTLTSHEVMVAQPALEMLADGQWVVPHYAGMLFLDKPPLVNWLTAGSFVALGGFSEFAARLPAALSAIGLAVLVAWLARRFYGNLAGLFAGLIQATCVYAYMQGRLGEIDMPFAFFIAAAHAALAVAWGGGKVGRWGGGNGVTSFPRSHVPSFALAPALAFYLSAAAATLAKGPLAVVLIGASVIAFCILQRNWRYFVAVLTTPALLVYVLLVGGWFVAAYAQAGGAATRELTYNSLDRFLGLHHLQQMLNPAFYLYTVPWLFLPWTVALAFGARRLWRDARQPDAVLERFLWAWLLGGLIFLSLSMFKHKHYAIPILPPLSVLAGYLLAVRTHVDPRRAKPFFAITFVVIPIVLAIVGGFVMPKRDHRRATVEFVQSLAERVPADAQLYTVGLGQSAVYPYLPRPAVHVNTRDPRDIDALLRPVAGQSAYVLTLQGHLVEFERRGVQFETVATEPPPKRKKAAPEQMLVLGRATFPPE
jgi:4-amino-4-deoxy-L-arabinose transferase-like glycosyltransferase